MTLPPPRAIIFDWDNTLVDTWPIIHEALVNTFTELGLTPWTIEMTRERVRKSMRDSFPEIFGADWQRAGEVYQRHYRAHHLGMLTPLPGAEELLAQLQARKLPVFVVSNKKGNNLREEIDHLGWRPYFTGIAGADDAPRDKPHCEPVWHALGDSGFEAGPDIWFVGDSDIDLECAKNTGCTPILYGEHARAHPSYSPTHYQTFPYHTHALTLEEVGELVKATLNG